MRRYPSIQALAMACAYSKGYRGSRWPANLLPTARARCTICPMDTVELECLIRPVEMNDTHFIFKTWLKSYRENLSKCPDLTYYKWQQLVIRRICQAPTSRVAVCCDASDQSFIYGFCVADTLKTTDKNEPLCVHFCFVKYSYRNQGLMKMMLDAHGWYRGRP